MAIPAPFGEVSLGSLRIELVNDATDDFALRLSGRPVTSGLAGATTPPRFTPVNQSSDYKPDNSAEFAISEWYRYDHSAFDPCSPSSFRTPNVGKFFTYYKISVTGSSDAVSDIVLSSVSTPDTYVYLLVYDDYPFEIDGSLKWGPADLTLYTLGSVFSVSAKYRKKTNDTEYLHLVCFESAGSIYESVTMNVCFDARTDDFGYMQVRARSTNAFGYVGGTLVPVVAPVTLNLVVTVGLAAYGDTIEILINQSSATSFISGLPANSQVINAYISSVSPPVNYPQIYVLGESLIGSC